MEYRGGTYIAQVRAESPLFALNNWREQLDEKDMKSWGISRTDLEKIIVNDTLVPLEGLLHVWCISEVVRQGLVLINLIATQCE
jgi:hypothetical protein